MDSTERDKQLMFDYCLLIPSATKTFFDNGNKITVLDGAHMYSKYEGVILTICGKDGEDHVVQLGFALVPQENKYYWQEVFNAIIHYLREHRMIMSDKAKGLDSIRELIYHVARTMPIGEVHQHKMHSVVYAQCIIHCSNNAGIQKSNIRALCVQWAKCRVESDQARKILQMKTAVITESQLRLLTWNRTQSMLLMLIFIAINIWQPILKWSATICVKVIMRESRVMDNVQWLLWIIY